MASPQHRVAIFPMRLRWSDGADKAAFQLKRDYPGNAVGYAEYVAKNLNVTRNTTIGEILLG